MDMAALVKVSEAKQYISVPYRYGDQFGIGL